MKKTIITSLITTAFLTAAPAFASTTDNVMIIDSWVRAAPQSAKVQAAFFTFMNHNQEPIVLTDVKATGFGHSELHLSSKKDGVMIMEQQQQITIPGNTIFKFKPGGYHVMLMQPEQIAAPGEMVKITFNLASGETITAEMPVKRDNSKMQMDHAKMDHSKMKHN